MPTSDSVDLEFWRVFSRALGKPVAAGRYTPADLPDWDSLRHVELIFELEEAFRVAVPPDLIAALYENTDAILDFLRSQSATQR